MECRQITIFGEEIPREPTEVLRDRDGKFLPGSSGNPSGRQKQTWEEREALEEVKKLSVGGEPVPTLEEALLAAKGRGVLFIELKGDTADRQMADDAVKIVRELGMEQESVMISLK